MRCPSCRNKIDDNDILCPYCGKDLRENKSEVIVGYRPKSSSRAIGIFIGAVIFLIIWGFFVVPTYNKTHQQTEQNKTNLNINSDYSLIEEMSLLAPDRSLALSNGAVVMQKYINELGFAGFASNQTSIECIDYKNEDDVARYMRIDYLNTERTLIYQENYTGKFEEIDSERWLKLMEWMYGVDIDDSLFISTLNNYKQTVKLLPKDTHNQHIAYDQDGIVIKFAQINDNGTYTIALYSKFMQEQ